MPKLKGLTDTSNFEEYDDDDDTEPYQDDGTDWDRNF